MKKERNTSSVKKMIIGVIVIVSLVAITVICINAGNSKEQTGNQENVQELTEEEIVPEVEENNDEDAAVSEEDRIAEYLSRDLTINEEKLGITLESREAFVVTYGIEEYEIGLYIAPKMMFYNEGNQGNVSETDTDLYKDDYQIETIEIESTKEDGYVIPADYVTNGDYGRDTVIMIHGAGENRRTHYRQTRMFLDMGYNVLQYDQRTCGDSKGSYCTYGFLEQYDLYDCIRYVHNKAGEEIRIAVFGSSQGGTTVIQALNNSEISEDIDVAILDCPMISQLDFLIPGIETECPEKYQDIALDSFYDFMEYFFLFDRNRYQYEELAKGIDTPILMFVSEADEILNVNVQKDFYETLQNDNKYLFVSDSAKHCCIVADHEAEYENLTQRALTGELFD